MSASSALKKEVFNISIPEIAKKESLDGILDSIPEGTNSLRLDFGQTKDMNRSFYPALKNLKKSLYERSIDLISVQISSSLRETVMAAGVISVFNYRQEWQPEKKKKPKKGIDVEFITPFVDATKRVLTVQACLECRPGKPRMKDKSEKSSADILGVLSLVSSAFEGSIVLGFPEATFLKICSKLMDQEFEDLESGIEDAAGELLNIIFGMAKATLNDKKDYEIKKAIPTIMRGQGIKIKQSVGPTIILPFETPVGAFQMEVEIADQ